MSPRRPAAVSDVYPGVRPARLRGRSMVADDATRLRLFRQQLETDGFLILGSIRPAGNRCHRPRNRREARGQSGAGARASRRAVGADAMSDGMATIRKNALPGLSGFWRKQALPEP